MISIDGASERNAYEPPSALTYKLEAEKPVLSRPNTQTEFYTQEYVDPEFE